MKVLTYDNTFEGFLTVIFECYRQKLNPLDICPEKNPHKYIFDEYIFIPSDREKAGRVWLGIQRKLSGYNSQLVFYAFLSEEQGIEMRIYRFAERLFNTNFNIETDFGDPDILKLKQVEQKVKREAMRMMQFVRFQCTADGIYFCAIEPRYDVFPLVVNHFKARFAGQKWILYDLAHDYGIYYDLSEMHEVVFSNKQFDETTGAVERNLLKEHETIYQSLWQSYFRHINIKERKNQKLQRQHMPRRFWRFLPETGCEV